MSINRSKAISIYQTEANRFSSDDSDDGDILQVSKLEPQELKKEPNKDIKKDLKKDIKLERINEGQAQAKPMQAQPMQAPAQAPTQVQRILDDDSVVAGLSSAPSVALEKMDKEMSEAILGMSEPRKPLDKPSRCEYVEDAYETVMLFQLKRMIRMNTKPFAVMLKLLIQGDPKRKL